MTPMDGKNWFLVMCCEINLETSAEEMQNVDCQKER